MQACRTRRLMRTLALTQDLADLLLTLPDLDGALPAQLQSPLFNTSILAKCLSQQTAFCIVGADGRWAPVAHPAVLSAAGLVSAAISIHKNWPT